MRRTAVGESDGAGVGIKIGASVGVTMGVLVGSGATSAKSAGGLRSSSFLNGDHLCFLLRIMHMLGAHVEAIG